MLVNGGFGADLIGRATEVICFFGNVTDGSIATIAGKQPCQQDRPSRYSKTDCDFTLGRHNFILH